MHEEFSEQGMESIESSTELKIGPDLRHLNSFVGIWDMSGHNGSDEAGMLQEKVVGTETYEWLSGNHFFVYRWDRTFSSGHHKGFGVFGFDQAIGSYYAQNFDNFGYARRYDVAIKANVMQLSGKSERAKITVSADGNELAVHWEALGGDDHWNTLCELKGRRIH